MCSKRCQKVISAGKWCFHKKMGERLSKGFFLILDISGRVSCNARRSSNWLICTYWAFDMTVMNVSKACESLVKVQNSHLLNIKIEPGGIEFFNSGFIVSRARAQWEPEIFLISEAACKIGYLFRGFKINDSRAFVHCRMIFWTSPGLKNSIFLVLKVVK